MIGLTVSRGRLTAVTEHQPDPTLNANRSGTALKQATETCEASRGHSSALLRQDMNISWKNTLLHRLLFH